MFLAERLERQVGRFCRQTLQFTGQEKILIACSGGTDSMALAELLYRLGGEQGWSLAICHVHHGLRGSAADYDAEQVAQYAAERQLPFFLRQVAVNEYVQNHGVSIEDAARRLRYQALEEVRCLSGCTLIATGHHKEDQAETVLMRLLRGAGPTGLSGIPPRRGLIVRPLLSVRRGALAAYCRERQLTVCEDASNEDRTFLRNRIRQVLLPQLVADYNPELVETLVKTASLCRQEDVFLNSLLVEPLSRVVWQCQDEALIPLDVVQSLPKVLQARFWRQLLRSRNGADTEVSFVHLEELVALVQQGKTGKKMPLPGGWLLECEYGALRLHKPEQRKTAAFSQVLPLSGQYLLPDGARLVARLCETRPVLSGTREEACFSLAELVLPLIVRTRLPGDMFRPAGGSGSKKLKDFFIDVKVPQRLRDGWPLVCDAAGILWLPGLRAAQRDEAGGPWLLLKRINREDKEYAPGY